MAEHRLKVVFIDGMNLGNLVLVLQEHAPPIAARFSRVENAAEAERLDAVEAGVLTQQSEEMRTFPPRSAGRREPVGAFVQTPFGSIAGHVVTAVRADSKLI